MVPARSLVGTAFVLAGCNALSGAADLAIDGETAIHRPSGTPYPDPTPGSSPPPGDDGGTENDTGGDADDRTDTAHDVTESVGLRIFVSAATISPSFGGTSGADERCQLFANAKGFGTKWVAWVSASGTNVKDRVTADGPWKLVTGTLVAANKEQLSSGTLAHAIDRDENGALVSNAFAWTGTTASGGWPSFGNDCYGWTNGSSYFTGQVGATARSDTGWTSENDTTSCAEVEHLYCIEQ